MNLEASFGASLDAVMRPAAEARGLPNACYLDAEACALERERVFLANWAGFGFASDVPEPGDARPVMFLDMPLLLMRDMEDRVRVFHNVCRHRGMMLVPEPVKLKGTVTCPYHLWCYGLDGKLRTTPNAGGPGVHEDPALDKTALGLKEIRAHVWRGVVFINMSGDAPPFEDYAGALIERWREFEGQPLYYSGPDSDLEYRLNTNWKLAVENYCEAYHLPSIHPGLNTYSKLEDHYNIQEQGPFSGQGTRVYQALTGAGGETFSRFKNLSEQWDAGAEYLALYPNVLLAAQNDHAYAFVIEAHGRQKTVERVRIFYASEDMTGPAYAAMRDANRKLWDSVFLEDVGVVEGMQRGRASPAFDGGKFAPVMDAPTHWFHRWTAEQLTGKTAAAADSAAAA
ncbi:MAG: aromatic ring-hydroxylating oxygenase subunit alpha [Rhodospirillales bacterium]